MRIVLIFFIFPLVIFCQNELPYKVGEYSEYNISFNSLKVGSAQLEILEHTQIKNKGAFHIAGKGKTTFFFDLFFKVRDVYETYLDTSRVLPIKFLRDIYEGGYTKKQRYRFKHSEEKVFYEKTQQDIYKNTQDMLSALYFARTFNKDTLNQTTSFFIPIFMDEENYFLEIKYLYNENVSTKFGKINCMVFKPKMQEGRVFEDGEKMKIWISNDKNHLLIKVETKIWTGLIKAILVKHKNLKYPLSISK